MDRSPFPRLTVFSQPVEEPRADAQAPVAPQVPSYHPAAAAALREPVRGGGAVPAFGDWREQREAHAVDSPVEQPIAAVVVDEAVRIDSERATMLVTPPDEFDGPPMREDAIVEAYAVEQVAAEVQVVEAIAEEARVARVQRSVGQRPSHERLLDAEHVLAPALDHEGLPIVDVDALRARDVARELLRARFIAIGERRERRSAWEIAFIMLAAAIAVLLTAPPLVQVLLAMHGVEA